MINITQSCKLLVAKVAKAVASSNANSTCAFVMHQPKLPKDVESLRKYK